MDKTNNDYTINEIKPDGRVVVTLGCDSSQHTISSLPIDDRKALKENLRDYMKAYKRGKESEAKAVDSTVSALIGKKQTAQEVEA